MTIKLLIVSVLLVNTSSGIGQAAVQSVETTVMVDNRLEVVSGSVMEFEAVASGPSLREAQSRLSIATNDGSDYSVTLAAALEGWSFTPAVPGNRSGKYPVLRFVAVEGALGQSLAGPRVLIDQLNSATLPFEIVGGIRSTAGEIAVTLQLESSDGVVAGHYRAELEYTLSSP